ncbi:hypothetical protein GCM10023149_52610 [Mucilaginibacter gynuensis]|uniref:Uncharacterized protein n=1 Tax=Mucilaginibacter gynuensis TaxID=1302236 RepID=A0ABP8HL38_9SPHI
MVFGFSNAQTIVNSKGVKHTCKTDILKTVVDDFKSDIGDGYTFEDKRTTIPKFVNLLNKDFKTRYFSNFCFVEYSSFRAIKDDEDLHLGLISIGFDTDAKADRALRIVKNTGRSNFRLKNLTMFTYYKRQKSLVIIFSETGDKKPVNAFLAKRSIKRVAI